MSNQDQKQHESPTVAVKSLPPAEVGLISNPIPSFSVYQWVPRGVRNLNRKNKLSSLPFWFPNETMRHHQFRLVLLRGVVREDREDDDAVAVFLEYIPPPPSEQPPVHPKGCRITMRLLNRQYMDEGSRAGDVIAEATATIDDVDRQVAFREFILPKHLNDADFVGGDGTTAILEVSIMTGVNVVVETVAKSAGSLWSAFSSISSSMSTFVKDAVQSTRLDQREEFSNGQGNGGNAEQPGAASFLSSLMDSVAMAAGSNAERPKRDLPWDTVPERWTGRDGHWHQLVAVTLVEDENTFLVGPRRGINEDEQLLLTQYGLNHRAIAAAASLFDYDRDVHEGLLSLPSLRSQRYRLVPQRITDVAFWSNFMWKVASLSSCGTQEQAQLLLSIVNSPPAETERKTPREGGDASGTASNDVGGAIAAWVQSAAVGISSTVRSGLRGVTPATDEEVAHAVKEAVEASATLEDLLSDIVDENSPTTEGDENDGDRLLMEAAASSCQRHMECLHRLRQRGVPEDLVSSIERALTMVNRSIKRFETLSSGRKSPPMEQDPLEAACGDELDNEDEAEERQVDNLLRGCRTTVDESHEDDINTDAFVPMQPAHDATQDVDTSVRQTTSLLTGKDITSSHSPPPSPTEDKGDTASPSASLVPPPEQNPSSGSVVSSFERLPSIDDMKTPAPRGPGGLSSSMGRQGSSSTRKLEFAPMPWEEDE
jgi:hypothetical protein